MDQSDTLSEAEALDRVGLSKGMPSRFKLREMASWVYVKGPKGRMERRYDPTSLEAVAVKIAEESLRISICNLHHKR